ncbi:MAG: metallophosphoesterase [Lachnospiraceae bacterium]|nr:metallophosphoesterase [Lachnospiraceae bacterium]
MRFMFFGILIGVIALFFFTLYGYFRAWKQVGLPKALFIAVETVLTLVSLYTAFGFRTIPGEALRTVARFVSAVQFVFLVYSGLAMLIRNLVCLILKVFKKGDGFVKAVKSAGFYGAVAAITVILGITGYISMSAVTEKAYSIDVNKKSVNDSVTLAVTSDFHIGTGTSRREVARAVDLINAMDADAALIVGDLIDSNTPADYLDMMVEEFSKVKTKYGFFFSFGNHDEMGTLNNVRDYLKKAGVRVLEDEAVTIADDVILLGRLDYSQRGMEMSEFDLDRERPVIVMNHQPTRLSQIAQGGADVVLSGHTHGHQFPLVELLVNPFNDNVYGLKYFDDMASITTCGVGAWGFHFKFPSRSEVVKLKINFK